MSEEITPPEFESYPCPLGMVIGYSGNSYLINTNAGELIGLPAVGEPSVENIEADIIAASQPNLPAIRVRLKASATERRWQVETAGISVGGVQVATDDRAKTLLTGADRKARRDSGFSTRWKGEDGTWAEVNAATIIAIADAVFEHVNACFAREEELHAAIDAAADLAALNALQPIIETFAL
ncbi:MAG: hypothetical protein K0R17_1028 [Rariglobus sp.]|jgi:hypothetical protein|nr:hypothetical protein [Rariglobus sp.]